jgi:apolipoprotein N-acyltransferase
MTAMINKVFFKNLSIKQYSNLLMGLLSGIILIAAFPPFEQGYLAWIALIPLLATCLEVKPARAFMAGVFFGLPLNIYLNLYLSNVLFPYLSTALALAAMIGLVLYISLFYGLFALAVSLVARLKNPLLNALTAPSLWILVEYLRTLSFMAYTAGFLGYSQWQYPLLLNISSVYGYWGLPFLMVFLQTFLILVLRRELRGNKIYAMAGLWLLLTATGLLLPETQPAVPNSNRFTVTLIQGNTSPETIMERGREENMAHYLTLTEEALAESEDVDMVVWPETVVDIKLEEGKIHHRPMIELAENFGVPLLYGARVHDSGLLYNAIALIQNEEEGERTRLYYKKRLVPFVEFFPMEQWLNRLLQLDLLLGRYTPGEETTLFQLDGITLAGVICFESYFGDHTRLFATAKSDHLFILTNDAWFGDSIGLEQHAQVAAIRAAEMGRGVTQVANSGITISFDYRGRELFRSGKNEVAIITRNLDLMTRETFYARYGDYFPAFWALFLLFAIPLSLSGRLKREIP